MDEVATCCLPLLVEFEVVKSFAVNTNHTTLADKSGGVHLVDDMENLTRLALLGQNEEHLDIIAGIETLCVEYCHPAVWLLVDAACYFLIMS